MGISLSSDAKYTRGSGTSERIAVFRFFRDLDAIFAAFGVGLARHEAPAELLSDPPFIEAMLPGEFAGAYRVPALHLGSFNFTGVTAAEGGE